MLGGNASGLTQSYSLLTTHIFSASHDYHIGGHKMLAGWLERQRANRQFSKPNSLRGCVEAERKEERFTFTWNMDVV